MYRAGFSSQALCFKASTNYFSRDGIKLIKDSDLIQKWVVVA